VNITPADLAVSHGVSWHTAWRWMRDIQKARPFLVHSRGRTLVAEAHKIRPFIPAPRRPQITREDLRQQREELRQIARRLDVEVRERIVLRNRMDAWAKRVAALEEALRTNVQPRARTRISK
jgi:hypothetical protein